MSPLPVTQKKYLFPTKWLFGAEILQTAEVINILKRVRLTQYGMKTKTSRHLHRSHTLSHMVTMKTILQHIPCKILCFKSFRKNVFTLIDVCITAHHIIPYYCASIWNATFI